MASTKVETYRIIARTSNSADYQHNLISLYDASDALIAQLLFTDNETPKVTQRFNHLYLIYSKSDYPSAVDILRNEDPVYLVTDNATTAGLRTRKEETGEEEGI